MSRIVVLGGRGFIGKAVVSAAACAGHEAIVPERQTWRLGMALPAICEDADAVIHLASATLVASGDRKAAMQLDIDGTRIIRDQIRAWRGTRLIFVSSQSAWEGARNDYGRSKFAIEQMLDQPREIIVRPGLVYDESGGSVFGVFEKLSRLPMLPVLSDAPCIQPIRVDELAGALLRIATASQTAAAYNLGTTPALTFAEMVQAVAARDGRTAPRTLRLPAAPIRLVAHIADSLLKLSPSLLERIDGLIALRQMDTTSSLEALDLHLTPF